jgi:hypothetical protein
VTKATELQPSYAPDVEIAGAAVGGLIPDLPKLWGMSHGKQELLKKTRTNPRIAVQKTDWAMFTPPTLLGLAHDYANFSKWLDENLIPDKVADFRKGERQCFRSNEKFYYNQDMGTYFKHGYKSLTEHPIPVSVMREAGDW